MKHGPVALMLQGTTSSAGKSLLTAGFCRLLTRQGFSVVPFKAQNMSLNSWITEHGEEMGIAQALQAWACGLQPDSRMNPVLLKPIGDKGSQIILRGKPIGILPYARYIDLKPSLWNEICSAYRDLVKNKDIVIIEGAGSPAEINLAEHDIVNMAVAHFADAKVLLVADIDRGGAFAALTGTMVLLPEVDRERIAGFVLNKFRGDKSLLYPAMEKVSAMWNTPFVGVMPMLHGLRFAEEDSVSLCDMATMPSPDCLDIAVIEMPAISNIADWDALAAEPGVSVRLVREGRKLGYPDLVLLPGSRNVPLSVQSLKENGFFEALRYYVERIETHGKGNLVGICAGLLLLGDVLEDSHGLEQKGSFSCLGLLEFTSCLEQAKTLARGHGKIDLGEGEYECKGYEIHHGLIHENTNLRVIARNSNGNPIGFGTPGNPCRVWGTWLHGIFDSDKFRHAYLDRLRREAGLPADAGVKWSQEADLDRVADAIEANFNVGDILPY